MNTKKLFISLLWSLAGAMLLTWMACDPPYIESIDQPDNTNLNSGFEVDVQVTNYGAADGVISSNVGIFIPPEVLELYNERERATYRLTFAIQVPQGWTVIDNIPFTGTYEGTFIYSDTLSELVETAFPPDSLYYWWACETVETMDDIGGTIYFTPVIQTDQQKGDFYLDYRLGYWDGEYYTPSCSESLDHLISCGLPTTVYVTSSASSGPGSLREAIDSVANGGTILFNLNLPATIYPQEEFLLYKNVTISGPEDNTLTISGSGTCRAFFVTAKHTTIEHLNIVNGFGNPNSGYGNSGGGICYNDDYTYQHEHILRHIHFNANQATDGGAVYTNRGHFLMEDIDFTNNSAVHSGGAIYFRDNATPNLNEVNVSGNSADYGGGIQFNHSNIGTLENTMISNNQASSYGGGIYISNYGTSIIMKNVQITNNSAEIGGGIYGNTALQYDMDQRCDIYANSAPVGPDLYGGNEFPIYLDKFTVIQPNDYFAYPEEAFEFDVLQGVNPMLDQDVFVSPAGSDLNTGTSPAQAFKTIAHALAYTYGDSQDPNTIHLAAGTYSPETNGEALPLYPHSHLKIQGAGISSTFLEQGSVYDNIFKFVKDMGFNFADLSFQNSEDIYRDLISLEYSSLSLDDFAVNGNDVGYQDFISSLSSSLFMNDGNIEHAYVSISASGSSVTCTNVHFNENNNFEALVDLRDNSTATFNECLFENNHSNRGTISVRGNSHINLGGTTIRNNHSNYAGGGLYFSESTAMFDPENLCSIYSNTSPIGNDLYQTNPVTNIQVNLDTFSVMYPTNYHAYPLNRFSFSINHGLIPQVNQDLYVSPDGSNENSGLTEDDPLLSVTLAFQMLMPYSDTIRTVHLASGMYSPSTTGESFPFFMEHNTRLSGIHRDSVTLNGGYKSQIIHSINSTASVENLRVYLAGGTGDTEGAIYCGNGYIHISNMVVENCQDGGIAVDNSTVDLENTIITHNSGDGLTFRGNCTFTSDSLEIHDNSYYGIYTISSTVTLEDLEILNNGNCGIRIEGGDVICRNIIAKGNGGANDGGGLLARDAKVFIMNSDFSENNGRNGGGGCFYNCSGIILNSTWNDNIVNAKGGGLYLKGSNMTIINNQVENNEAASGGGIYFNSSPAVLTGSSIMNNKASNGGGGAFIYYGDQDNSPFFLYCELSFNEANTGGGCLVSAHSLPYFSSTNIYANWAVNGGGIWMHDYSSIEWDEINRCNVYFNLAEEQGNDLFSGNNMNVVPVVVDTFTVLDPTDIHAWQVDMFNFDILNGALEMGDYDVYVSPLGNDFNSGLSPEDPLKTIRMATIKAPGDTVPPYVIHLAAGTYSKSGTGENFPVKIKNNTTLSGAGPEHSILDGEDGSQVFNLVEKEHITLESLGITGGFYTGAYGYGGAIYCENNSDLLLSHMTIDSCLARLGGALYTFNSEVFMEEVELKDNEAISQGGAWYATGKNTAYLHRVSITGNEAGSGAGLSSIGSLQGHSDLKIKGDQVKFENNRGTGANGGAIFMHYTDFLMNNFIINENSAYRGGGVYFHSSEGTLHNFLVTNDTASTAGGAMAGINTDINLVNCTFAGNFNQQTGSLYFSSNSHVTMKNCISWANGLSEAELFGNSYLTVDHCDIQGGEEGIVIDLPENLQWLGGNLDEDPLFLMSGEHPYQLTDGSPCIETGGPDTTGWHLPMWDLLGNLRMWDSDGDGDTIVDIGAYEFASVGVGAEEPQNFVSWMPLTCHPNPVKEIAHFTIQITKYQSVSLKMYDLYGHEMGIICEKGFTAGTHQVEYDVSHLPAGMYVVRMEAGSVQGFVKMLKY